MNEVKIDGEIVALSDKVVGRGFFIGEVKIKNVESNGDKTYTQYPVLQFQGDKGKEGYQRLRVGDYIECTGNLKGKDSSKFTNVAIWKCEVKAPSAEAPAQQSDGGFGGGPFGGGFGG